ncbi:MAG: DinB family protein [Melioribacteraceae bacterium]|nr:MAG: DinB family protein [Melioribacteraceae bacterium]
MSELQNKYLLNLEKQFEDLKTSVKNLTEDLSEEKFNTKPAPDSWSVAECISHLNATWNPYKKLLDEAIANNQNSSVKNPDDFKPRFIMKKFTEMMEPPYKFKMKTFAQFVSSEKLSKQGTINKFNDTIEQAAKYIHACENVDIKKTIIVSPVSKVIKYQLGELFPFLAAHARRHIWQAENVKKIIL